MFPYNSYYGYYYPQQYSYPFSWTLTYPLSGICQGDVKPQYYTFSSMLASREDIKDQPGQPEVQNQQNFILREKEETEKKEISNMGSVDEFKTVNYVNRQKDKKYFHPTQKRKRNEIQKIQQKCWDRNAKSNLLKVYLKQLREDMKRDNGYHRQIIKNIGQSYTMQQFQKDLLKTIDFSINYVRPQYLKKVCQNMQRQYDERLVKTVKKSIQYFLTEQIYRLNDMSKGKQKIIKQDHYAVRQRLLSYLLGNKPE